MKGYFSRLAESTGLRFEPGKSSAQIGTASQLVRSGHRETATAPFEVEAVAFTESATATTPDSSTNLSATTSYDTADSIVSPSGVATSPPQDFRPAATGIIVTPGEAITPADESRLALKGDERSSDSLEEIRIQYIEPTNQPPTSLMETRARETERKSSRFANQRPFAESDRAGTVESYEPLHLLKRIPETANPMEFRPPDQNQLERQLEWIAQPRSGERATPSAEAPDSERPTVADYLSEVRAWLAANPETIKTEVDKHRRTDDKWPGDFMKTVELNQNVSPPAEHSPQPEQQELSLSIGTISVVIEEPNRAVAPPLPPPPAPRSISHDTARQPSSLSRYYLRSW